MVICVVQNGMEYEFHRSDRLLVTLKELHFHVEMHTSSEGNDACRKIVLAVMLK